MVLNKVVPNALPLFFLSFFKIPSWVEGYYEDTKRVQLGLGNKREEICLDREKNTCSFRKTGRPNHKGFKIV